MQSKLLLFFLLLAANALNAQTSSVSTSLMNEEFFSSATVPSTDNWSFYLDEENKTYYIDFETINVNLSDIKVIDTAGEVVMSDNLWDLPVNTIYELNLHGMKPGDYKIELRTYTGVIQKEVTIL